MKKVSWLLVAVMLATMLVPQVAAPVLAAEAIQLQEDFEAYAPGPFGGSGSPWSVVSKEGCSMEVVTEGTNQVFKASLSYAGASQTTNDSYIQSSAYDFSGKTILSFRIKMENKNQGSMNLILRDTNANAGLGSLNLFSISNTQVKYLTDMQAAAVTETVDTEQWMTIQIVMDIANQTVTAYRDGVQKARAENIRSISSKLEGYNFAKASLRYQLYVGKTAGNTVKMLLDDISMQSDFAADARFIVTGYTLTKQIGTISRPITDLYPGELTAGAQVRNVTDQAQSVVMKAELYRGDVLLQSAKGSLTQLAPQQIAPVSVPITITQLEAGDTLRLRLYNDLACTVPVSIVMSYEKGSYARPLGEELIANLKQTNPNQAHPRILVDAERMNYLKTACKTDPTLSAWYTRVKASADTLAASTTYPSYEDADELRLSSANTVQANIMTCAFAYCIDGEEKYAQRVYGEIQNAASWPDWNPKHFLDTSAIIGGFAIAYDWLYDYWTSEQAELIRSKMVSYGLNEARDAYNGVGVSDWWATTDNNWSMVCNGGVAMGALAIGDEAAYETLCAGLLETGLRRAEKCLDHFAPDGAWYEGPGYWHYTVQYMTMYFSTLLSATGSDYGYLNTPGISKTGYFPIGMTGLANTFNLHDAGESKIGAPELFFLGTQFSDSTIASYRYYQITQQGFKPEVKDILWFDPSVISGVSGLDTDFKFRDIEVATFRSSYFAPDSVYAGLHGGLNGINHGQIDAGNFIYESQGVRWAVDLGGDNYNLSNYFNSSNTEKSRWAYYRNRGEGHNTVILNPGLTADQPLNQKATLSSFSSTDAFGVATVNMQPIYGAYTTSAQRGLWLDKKSGGLLVQDELQFTEAGGNNLYWFMHTRAAVEVAADGKSAVLTQNGKRLWVGILDETHTFTVENAVPLPTSPNPNEWPENQANAGDSSNPKTQNANNGVRKLSIHDSNAGGAATVSVYMAPLDAQQSAPEQLPAAQAISAWPQNVTGLKISSTQNLHQATDSTSPVTFTADAFIAAADADLAAAEWYVNGVKQTAAQGVAFTFTPTVTGEYTVYAQIGAQTNTKSNEITVEVAEQPAEQSYLMRDDFENHGVIGTKLTASNVAPWDGTISTERELVKITADPENPDNKVAQYFNNTLTGTGYPRLEKRNIALTAGVPVVFSGKVRLKQLDSSMYIDLLKYIDGQKKSAALMNLSSNGGIRVAGQTVSGVSWRSDGWVRFALSLTPDEGLNSGTVRLSLSGTITGEVYSTEKTINLSSLQLSEDNVVTVYYNTSISYQTGTQTGVDTGIYLDDAAMYTPAINTLSAVSGDDVAVNQPAQLVFRFHHDIDPATFDASKIMVMAADGNIVSPSGVAFDIMRPDTFTLSFAENTLQMGTSYFVMLTDSVRDVTGGTIYGTPSFTTKGADPIGALTITAAEGQLEQPNDEMGPVRFIAQTVPAEYVDLSTIEWYVNDSKQNTVGTDFTYTPSAVGSYAVVAKAGTVCSNTLTITVTPGGQQTYLLADDFESHGAVGTRLTTANVAPWDNVSNNTREFAYIAADPEDTSNKVVQLYNNNDAGSGWPRLEKHGIALKAGTPFVLSGRVRLKDATSTFYPQFVKWVGDTRKTVNTLELVSNGVIKVGGAAVANALWSNDGWINYSICVTPGEDLTSGTIRVILTGAVSGGMVTAQSSINLSGLQLGGGNQVMIYMNTYIPYDTGVYAGANTGIYMDDVLMYEPAVPQMSVANSAQAAIYDNNEITVTFNTPIDPTTLDSTKVLVTETNGKQTPISTFAFDPANPTQFTIGFYEAALEAGRTYHITLDPSVTNIAGISVAGEAAFTTVSQEFILFDDFETEHGELGQVFDTAHCAPWSWAANAATEFVRLASDPKNSANRVAQFGYDGLQSKYPRLQKNSVTFTPGQTVILSGRILLKNTTSTSYLELVKGSRVTVFELSTAGRILAGKNKEQIAGVSWQPGEWVTFQARITPTLDASQSQLELVFHGGVTGGVTRVQKTLDLSSIGVAEPLNIYFNNMLTKNNSDENYIDDVKIYVQGTENTN